MTNYGTNNLDIIIPAFDGKKYGGWDTSGYPRGDGFTIIEVDVNVVTLRCCYT